MLLKIHSDVYTHAHDNGIVDGCGFLSTFHIHIIPLQLLKYANGQELAVLNYSNDSNILVALSLFWCSGILRHKS